MLFHLGEVLAGDFLFGHLLQGVAFVYFPVVCWCLGFCWFFLVFFKACYLSWGKLFEFYWKHLKLYLRTMAEATTQIWDRDALLFWRTSILLSLGIIGRLKGIVLSNHQWAPIHSYVSVYECEGTSLSTEEEREAKGACKCLMWPAQKGLINFLEKITWIIVKTELFNLIRGKNWTCLVLQNNLETTDMMRKQHIPKSTGCSRERENYNFKL